jgi:hypothetical protein
MAKLFEHNGELSLGLPAEIATRYHLAPDVEVEIITTDDGILLHPVGVAPWFSVEWEQALDAVVEQYRPALEMVGAEPEAAESDNAGAKATPEGGPARDE